MNVDGGESTLLHERGLLYPFAPRFHLMVIVFSLYFDLWDNINRYTDVKCSHTL